MNGERWGRGRGATKRSSGTRRLDDVFPSVNKRFLVATASFKCHSLHVVTLYVTVSDFLKAVRYGDNSKTGEAK